MDFPKSVPGVGLVAGRYVDENQATGQPGTLITAQAMNALTDEILAVLAEAGIDPDELSNVQLRDAIKAIVERKTEGIDELLGVLSGRITALDSKLDSVILYPNGTAAAPANAASQARYVIPNPFPGFHVDCVAEIKIGANWGATNWHFDSANSTSYGINAEVYGAAAENIVVQVGKYLLGNSVNGGDPFGGVSVVTTAPWRLVVKKMKGAL